MKKTINNCELQKMDIYDYIFTEQTKNNCRLKTKQKMFIVSKIIE